MWARPTLVLVAFALSACSTPEASFTCSTNAQCSLKGEAGHCELTGFCSFPDPQCASSRRYHSSAGPGLQNECVEHCGDTLQACCTVGPACKTPTMACTDGRCESCLGSIAAGGARTCVVRSTDTKVICWGENTDGQVGAGNTSPVLSPQVVQSSAGGDLDQVDQVATGDHRTDGSVWCWGANDQGQLGDGTTVAKPKAVQVKTLTNATSVACGANHSCARTATGKIVCWGSNVDGQLGDGTTVSHSVPAAVLLPGPDGGLPGRPLAAEQVGAGEGHTCTLSGDTMLCWGGNRLGQLGIGTTSETPTVFPREVTPPATINWSGLASMSLGEGHTCVRRSNAFVYCWGEDEFGQLGQGLSAASPVPTPVLNSNAGGLFAGTVEIYAGEDSECALKGDGTMWCWGNNGNGQLGTGIDATLQPYPSRVMLNAETPLTNVAQGAAAEVHGCALRTDGSVWCWGLNSTGTFEFGQTAPLSSDYPVQVPLSCQ
jgi:alpha-tubulin suppressor-like RCC1 family protein